MMNKFVADNDISVEIDSNHTEVYERYCQECGYDFNLSRVGVNYLSECPVCHSSIRLPVNLMGRGLDDIRFA